jgi:GH15 family glucan-1,4-alpha-glucosidase
MHPIKDHFLIGDLHTAALVSAKGSIDWLCLPYFDSWSVFAAVLDKEKGGTFALDTKGLALAARYAVASPIVEIECKGKGNAFLLRDFMLPRPTEDVVPHFLIRKVTGTKGTSTVRFVFDPRPQYGKQQILLSRRNGSLFVRLGERCLTLHLPSGAKVTHRPGRRGVTVSFEVKKNETKQLILEYSVESRLHLKDRPDFERETREFWQNWLTQGKFFPYHKQQMIRSAITLKLMQFYPTGGLVAAPTTSLPEWIGGIRNWDYRYVWVRDATFTLYAFYVLGFTDEAKKLFRFFESVATTAEEHQDDFDLSHMFTIWGQEPQHEESLNHLSGYRDSKPVRIGNGANSQFQLDTYGSLLDAYYFMSKLGVPLTERGKDVMRYLAGCIKRRWKDKENGIWEVRGGERHFTYGKVMAWVGIDRFLAMADQLGLSKKDRQVYEKLREEIEEWVWKHCFDEATGKLLQHPDTKAQDASAFLFVLLRFLDRHEDRTKTIIRNMRDELSYEDLFVYRYKNDDGLAGEEGAFILCSFWMIASLAAVGEIPEAERLLDKMTAFMPESGLIAEEVDPENGEYLGNFPQAFSHIGFILSAHYIHRYKSRQAADGSNGVTVSSDPELRASSEKPKPKPARKTARKNPSKR